MKECGGDGFTFLTMYYYSAKKMGGEKERGNKGRSKGHLQSGLAFQGFQDFVLHRTIHRLEFAFRTTVTAIYNYIATSFQLFPFSPTYLSTFTFVPICS